MWSHFVLLLLSASLAACAHVTSWGGDFKPIPEEDNQYSLRLYPNAFATREDVEKKAKIFITEFMERNSFKDYEILNIVRGTVIEAYDYTFKFYKNNQERKLNKFKTKQQQLSRGPVDFTDDNPDFAERIRSTQTLLLLVDITATHFDASARSGEDAIIDLTESREAAHTLADELSKRLKTAGYEVKETIHSSGWSVGQNSYRIRHRPVDRSLSPKELPLESPPFYLEERYIEESASLEKIYRELEVSEDLIFSGAASLAKKYDTDAIFIVLGIAQIPTEGRALMGALDTLSMSSTHNARVWLSRSAIMVAAQIIDAKTGKQIGFASKGTQLDKQISTESLISVADQILKDYPKR